MEKQLFNIKFAVKRLERAARKCQKEEREEREKLKRALLKQNTESARIHAESSIRKRNQHVMYIKLSSRLDALAAQLTTAMSMRAVTSSMRGVVSGLEHALSTDKLDEVARLMGRFEQAADHMHVQADSLEATVVMTAAGATHPDEVNDLLQQVADENGLAVDSLLLNTADIVKQQPGLVDPKQGIEDRLAKLREL